MWKFFIVWTNWRTLAAAIWRFSVAVSDWRTILRMIMRRPIIDVVFISNMRGEVDRKLFLGKFHPFQGHFNGPRYWINGIVGRTRALDLTSDDLSTEVGLKKARKFFISAVEWAEIKGAKVILLAADTKRIFEGSEIDLRKRFSQLIFSMGDNGTSDLLIEETFDSLRRSGLRPGSCRIAILGPYGFLGRMMVRSLKEKGYDLIGVGSNKILEEFGKEEKIQVTRSLKKTGSVDAVVACTHSKRVRLNSENIDLIRREGKKLLAMDVAKPSNMNKHEYRKCAERVIRRDVGNAYSPDLKYVLGVISYSLFRLSRGETFGCFAEALSIFSSLKRGEKVREIDWFHVSEANMEIVKMMFQKDNFTAPSPRCFGKPILSFDLKMETEETEEVPFRSHSQWKMAFNKVLGFFL